MAPLSHLSGPVPLFGASGDLEVMAPEKTRLNWQQVDMWVIIDGGGNKGGSVDAMMKMVVTAVRVMKVVGW
ncbi:hypothetical protein LIER_26549 [Lithospermum erythrorhizon]|uniref:Uncharacterized protein n=1 Tax=Lithospermum erythrorhizon TaxID=34254 RepID=A0AAV3RBZ4_LITER